MAFKGNLITVKECLREVYSLQKGHQFKKAKEEYFRKYGSTITKHYLNLNIPPRDIYKIVDLLAEAYAAGKTNYHPKKKTGGSSK